MQRITVFKLHELIKSLKKGEKRSFKLFAKKYNKDSDVFYIQVFDYLDKTEVVDREKFKKKFDSIKGLSGIQHYLYNQILKSLRLQKSQKNIDLILMEGLGDIEVLVEKELIYAAKEKLEDLLELAKLHDKVFYIPLIHYWWFKLETSKFHYRDVDLLTLEASMKRYQDSISILNQYSLYQRSTGRLMFYLTDQNSRQAFDLANEMDKKLPIHDVNNTGFSLFTAIEELQLRRFLSAILRKPKKTYHYAKQLSSLLKQQPKGVLETYKPYYFGALSSQMTYAPNIDVIIPILKEFKDNPVGITNNLSLLIILTQMDVYLLSGTLETSYQYILEIAPSLEKLKKTTPSSNFGIWHYKVAIYYYATKNYKKSLEIIQEHLDNKNIDQLVKNAALLLKIVIYYEEEEYIILSSFLNNFRRYLRKNDALLFFEKEFLSLMMKLINSPKSEHKQFLSSFREGIRIHLTTAENHEKEILVLFNYMGWLDSQIDQSSFQQLYFRHVGNIPF